MSSKQILGLLAVGVVVGWAVPKAFGTFTSDAIVIDSTAQNALATDDTSQPQVSLSRGDDLTSGLSLATGPSEPILSDDQAEADVVALTEQQQALIKMLEQSSRQMNANGDTQADQDVVFDHLAVTDQTVRHYYTVDYPYAAIDNQAFMQAQSASISSALCGNAALRDLIGSLGLTYSYTYLSRDARMMGQFVVTPTSCAG